MSKYKILISVIAIFLLSIVSVSAANVTLDFENPFNNTFVMAVNTSIELTEEYTGFADKETETENSELYCDFSDMNVDFGDETYDDTVLMSETEPVSYAIGDVKTIYSKGIGEYVELKVVGIGEKYTLWANSSLDYQGEYDFVGEEFDSVICDMFTNMFGEWYDVDGDGKVGLLIYELWDGKTGYVNTYDMWKNEIDCVNLNCNYLDTINATLAHEFTHLLSYSQRKYFFDTWIEEGIATIAEDIYGGNTYIDVYNRYHRYMDNGLSFLEWGSAINYSQANMFMNYLNEQVKLAGGKEYEIFSKIVKCTEYKNYKVIEQIMQEYYPDITMQDLLFNYSVALLAKESTGPYGFGGNKMFDDIIVDINSGYSIYVGMDKYTLLGGGYSVFRCEDLDLSNIKEKGDNIRYVGFKYAPTVHHKVERYVNNTGIQWIAYIDSFESTMKYKVILAVYDEDDVLYGVYINDYDDKGHKLDDGSYRYETGTSSYIVYEGEDSSYVPPEDDEHWSLEDDRSISQMVIKGVHDGSIQGFIVYSDSIIPVCEKMSMKIESE